MFYNFVAEGVAYLHENANASYYTGNFTPNQASKIKRRAKKKQKVENERSAQSKHEGRKPSSYVWDGYSIKKILHDQELDLIVDGVVSTYVGTHPVAVGHQPGGFVFPTLEASTFFRMREKEFLEEGVDVSKCVAVRGSYDTNRPIIQRQIDRPAITASAIPKLSDVKKYRKALKMLFRKLDPVTINLPNKRHLGFQRFKMDANAGYRYDAGLKLRKKKQCAEIALAVAEKDFDEISVCGDSRGKRQLQREKLSTNEIHIGARNKLTDDLPKAGDEDFATDFLLTSRVVHMPDFHREIIVSALVDPISDHIKGKAYGPLYIGNSISRWERLKADMTGALSGFEGDWRRFDASLIVLFLLIATAILRTYSPEGTMGDMLWLYVLDSLVIKDYVLPGGCVIRILNGLASGSKATTLIGSVVNLFILCVCCVENGVTKFKCAIGGDDFLIFLFQEIEADFIERFMTTAEGLGFFLKENYKCSNFKEKKLGDCLSFYKYCIFNGEPHVRKEHILQMIFTPWEKFRRSPKGQAERILETLAAIGKPGMHCEPIYAYYVFLKGIHRRKVLKISDRHELEKRAKRDLEFIVDRHLAEYRNVCLAKRKDFFDKNIIKTKHTTVIAAIQERRKRFIVDVVTYVQVYIVDLCLGTRYNEEFAKANRFKNVSKLLDKFIPPVSLKKVDGRKTPQGQVFYFVYIAP